MLTQKVLQSLLLHHSLGHENCPELVLLELLNDLCKRLEHIETLLEKRQIIEVNQFKIVQRLMLSKVEKQLQHIEQTHAKTFTELTTELKAVKEVLNSTKSKFIGFE